MVKSKPKSKKAKSGAANHGKLGNGIGNEVECVPRNQISSINDHLGLKRRKTRKHSDLNGNTVNTNPAVPTKIYSAACLVWSGVVVLGALLVPLLLNNFGLPLRGVIVPENDEVPESNLNNKFVASFQRTLHPSHIAEEITKSKGKGSNVKLYTIDNFLSEKECDSLMAVHIRHVQEIDKLNPIICFEDLHTLQTHLRDVGRQDVRVTQADFTEGTLCVNESFSIQLKSWLNANWSYSTSFYPGESKFSLYFSDRVEQAMGLKSVNGGKFQITSYPKGIGYKSHTDCDSSKETRDRFATILVYLLDVEKGGETIFPELGVKVKPKKGMAIVWNNMDASGRCDPMSVHEAAVVEKGHKFIIQRWYYYESFETLGHRTQEPLLPARVRNQPRVSCDEYKNGSCRWYDEWNYNHITEYNEYLLHNRI